MLQILDGQQGSLVPGKLLVTEQSPLDVLSPKLETAIQPQLRREKGPAQTVGVTFEQGQKSPFG